MTYSNPSSISIYHSSEELVFFNKLSGSFLASFTSTLPKSFIDAELAAADMFLKREEYEKALLHLDFVSRVGPDAAVYAGRKADVYLAMGKPELAIPCLESAAALRGDLSIRLELAEAYKENGEFTKAVVEYEKLLSTEADPNWVRQQIVKLTRQKLLAAESLSQPGFTQAAHMQKMPDSLLLIAPASRCAIVEKESQTLFLYHSTANGFELERTFACSTGAQPGEKIAQGDARTPEGVYFLRTILPWSQLPEIYGKKAITLDYPNAFDQLEGKSGDGIWLHATNEPMRAFLPNKTRGCVVVRNEDIEELSSLLTLNQTPFVIVPKIRYGTNPEMHSELEEIRNFLSEWRYRWENMQLDRYIQLYSSRFRNGNQDINAWRTYKESVFTRAGKIRLDVQLQSVIQENRYAILTFYQDYHSDRLASRGIKRLVVVRENGAWKIIAEEMIL